MGTACNKFDLKHIERLKSDKWDELVPITALRPGYEETRLNFQKVGDSKDNIFLFSQKEISRIT